MMCWSEQHSRPGTFIVNNLQPMTVYTYRVEAVGLTDRSSINGPMVVATRRFHKSDVATRRSVECRSSEP